MAEDVFGRDILLGIGERVVERVGFFFPDLKRYDRLPSGDAPVLEIALQHTVICLCQCGHYKLVGVILDLFLRIGRNLRSEDEIFGELVRSFVLDNI